MIASPSETISAGTSTISTYLRDDWYRDWGSVEQYVPLVPSDLAPNAVIEAGDSITIKTGSASITMKKDGTITIKGKDITIQGSGKVNIKADGDVVVKGSKILQN